MQNNIIGMIGGLILLQGDNFMSEFASVGGLTAYLSRITKRIKLADGLSGEVMVPGTVPLTAGDVRFRGTSHDHPGRKTGTMTQRKRRYHGLWPLSGPSVRPLLRH